MQSSITYPLLVRALALLLMIGMAMPSGLHAKQLIDYCLNPSDYISYLHSADHEGATYAVHHASTGDHAGIDRHSRMDRHSKGTSGKTTGHDFCQMNEENAPLDEAAHSKDTAHQDCGWGFICACHIDRASLSDQNWTVPSKLFTAVLVPLEYIDLPSEREAAPSHVLSEIRTYSAPPIYLLNRSLLN